MKETAIDCRFNKDENIPKASLIYDVLTQMKTSVPTIDDINIFSIDLVSDALAGDVNFDGVIDILDIVLTVNFVLSVIDPSVNEFQAADMNSDGSLDVLDIVIIVNLILG